MRRRTTLGVSIAAGLAALAPSGDARAYNGQTHQQMTDYAYETMRAVANAGNGGPVAPALTATLERIKKEQPALTGFFADIGKAVPKLGALPSALPDKSVGCSDPGAPLMLTNAASPDWNIGSFGSLANVPMSKVAFPITTEFVTNAGDCDIDIDWAPGGIFDVSNPGSGATPRAIFASRDHTGTTLGFWAESPDDELDDWHMQSPYATEVDIVKTLVETEFAVAATTFISMGCLFVCIAAPPACASCVQAGAGAVEGGVEAIDSIPDLSDWKDGMFTGMGHHIDMKPPSPANLAMFDDRHGYFMDDPGPFHAKDSFESLVGAMGDLFALHVLHDASLGPKNYEIALPGSGDFRPNTLHRSSNAWEAHSFPHTQFTPVDNLAMFGWQQFEARDATSGSFPAPGVAASPSSAAKRFGWPLHAIGDATVPMHVTNTAGWGHRPYEDAVQAFMQDPTNPLLSQNDPAAQASIVGTILQRAFQMRASIVTWRAAHPALVNEVPVRDIVSSVAQATFQKAMAQSGTIFSPDASLDYLLDKTSATAAFESSSLRPVYLDSMIDGIAAEIAFLTSAAEVMP